MKSIWRNFGGMNWLHPLAVFLLVFSVYLWSMPATVVLEDDGFFILAAYFNALAHPPGYPLFTMAGHMFTWLPTGSVAFRVHMASACFGALACAALWILIKLRLQDRLCAYVAALGLGFSTTFWSQAIIAEVYTLNALLFIILLVLAQRCTGLPEHRQNTCLQCLAFTYGLSLSNHWPLIVLSTPALIILLWPLRKRMVAGAYTCLPFLVAGLLPYAWMIWRTHVVPEASFYGPINTPQEFWYYVSRKIYAGIDYSQTAGLPDKLQFAGFTLAQTVEQFGLLGTGFAVAGIFRLWTEQQRMLLSVTAVAYLSNTFLLILLLGFDFDYFHRATFMVYPIIAYTMVAFWIAYGIKLALAVAGKVGFGSFAAKYLVPALGVLVVCNTLLANIPQNFRKHDYLAMDYARLVLDTLEPDAIFYSNADNIDGPVDYLNRIEKVRPDVTVFTGRYLVADNKLYRPYQLHAGDLKKLIDRFIGNTDRPVYYTNDFPNTYGRVRYGLYTKVNRTRHATDRDTLMISYRFVDFFKRWQQGRLFVNSWDIMHYNLLRSDYCDLLVTAQYSGNGEADVPALAETTGFICANYQGVLNRLKFALQDPATTAATLENLLDQGRAYSDQAYTKEETSRLFYYQGLYYLRIGNEQQAQNRFSAAIAAWPHPDNPAITRTNTTR